MWVNPQKLFEKKGSPTRVSDAQLFPKTPRTVSSEALVARPNASGDVDTPSKPKENPA